MTEHSAEYDAPEPMPCYADTTPHDPHTWKPFLGEGPTFACPGVEPDYNNWLAREFERARKRREQLPKWARPVVTRKRENVVLIDFGDGVERECILVRPGPEGSWVIRSPEGAEGYYSGPFTRVIPPGTGGTP